MAKPKIRLCVEHPLAPGNQVELSRDQANYLFNVMRLATGEAVTLINGRDGAFTATVAKSSKRGGTLDVTEKTAELVMPPDIWLLFAPIKKARTDFIVEKAAELGVRKILPVQTEFTNSERIRQDRLQAHVVEAIEQCEGTFVPEVAALQKLTSVLEGWPKDRRLWFCDETLSGDAVSLPKTEEPAAIIIGPEGGFSDGERNRLRSASFTHPVSLGPRILRADTAAVAALTLWQASNGDWA